MINIYLKTVDASTRLEQTRKLLNSATVYTILALRTKERGEESVPRKRERERERGQSRRDRGEEKSVEMAREPREDRIKRTNVILVIDRARKSSLHANARVTRRTFSSHIIFPKQHRAKTKPTRQCFLSRKFRP